MLPAHDCDPDVLGHAVHLDLDGGGDLAVALRDQLDNVLGVLLEDLDGGARHEARHGLHAGKASKVVPPGSWYVDPVG